MYVYTHIYTYRYGYMCVHVQTYCLDVSIPFCVYLTVSRAFCCPMFISFIHHFFQFLFLLICHFLSSPMYFIVFHLCISKFFSFPSGLPWQFRMPWQSATATASSARRFEHASKFRRACLSVMAWSLTHEERKSVT